jgi:deazaflavin-dependent oxidoreductase (nitroreductase family)
MKATKKSGSPWFWRIMRPMKRNFQRMFDRGIGPVGLVLLLTTVGRRSGLPRITPLQYERAGNDFVVASGRGAAADWYANILACRNVQVQVGREHYQGLAEPVTDPRRITDFFELRLRQRPLMFRLMLWMEGVPLRLRREDLERLAEKKTMVVIHTR